MSIWTSLVHKFLGHGRYNSTLPTATDGAETELQTDARGRLIVALGAILGVPTSSTAGSSWTDAVGSSLTHRGVISATAGKALLWFSAQSDYASDGFIQIHDADAVGDLVSGTTEPKFSYRLPANGLVAIDLPRGRVFSTGIVWAFSSTAGVYTSDTSATVAVHAEHV